MGRVKPATPSNNRIVENWSAEGRPHPKQSREGGRLKPAPRTTTHTVVKWAEQSCGPALAGPSALARSHHLGQLRYQPGREREDDRLSGGGIGHRRHHADDARVGRPTM